MRKPYFTEETIEQDADLLQKQLFHFQTRRPFSLNPEAAGLVILDMQRYFLDPASHAFVPSASAIVPGIVDLIRSFQERELPVLLTRHVNTPQNAGSLSRWWSDIIEKDSEMSELIPEFQELDTPVLEKEQYDAFFGTDLEEWLHEHNVSQLIIGGVMTHLCCETTARSAFVRGFEVFFLIDGTATYHLEFHRSSLLTLSHGFVHPVRIREIVDLLLQEPTDEGNEGGIDLEVLHDKWQGSG